ncbi:hypothetical protein BC332_00560 [Capsicum chinense]|nr:hypothetical protein BC332_00560 [Capsicum chinense]
MDRTWTVVGVGGSPRVPSSEISGEEDQVCPCEQLDVPFERNASKEKEGKFIVIDEMLRGVENKHRSGDSRIGQPFELLLNPWAGKRQLGKLKHLSNLRKRKQKRFP